MSGALLIDSVFDYVDTLTVDDPSAGQNIADGVDFKQSTRWDLASNFSVSFTLVMTEARICEAIGIVGHNLGSEGIGVMVESWNGASYDVIMTTQYPADDFAKVLIFDTTGTTTDQIRVTFSGNCINAYIQHMQIGSYIDLLNFQKPPFSPPGIIDFYETVLGATDKQYAGRMVRQQLLDIEMNWTNIDPDIFHVFGNFIIDGMTKRPFFYAWDITNYPNECAYCWSDGPLSLPAFNANFLMDWKNKFKGVR